MKGSQQTLGFGTELWNAYGFEILGQTRRAFFRPTGCASAGQLADLITFALSFACSQNMREIVINISSVTGFESPGPAFRRWAVRRWAQASERTLHIALVARHEHICPHMTGLVVAAQEGLKANIFESETEAIKWLDSLYWIDH